MYAPYALRSCTVRWIRSLIVNSRNIGSDLKSSLKLKTSGAGEAGIRKKKKKTIPSNDESSNAPNSHEDIQMKKTLSDKPSKASSKTPAELKFQEMQEKRQVERIMKKAEKTHKQRVEEFNKHLDALSEHYDIPKVSWTK
ncbi:protein FAM32A-like isoform X2 [Paramacrobiotus metropolitanus]|uniref:protein FAM32A-like isoform X2 n=1 Tax=Paramacrobiotus metropolitanus TaxID=2943436 RepID=UPI0024465B60|nr:protein FAM32A-like isoform X2 [Paramacrobiotus metropolitanus]